MNKHYDKEFKDKVVLEDIKGEKTIQELATLYSVHPNLVVLWKKQLEENAPELFERSQKDKEKEAAEHKQEERQSIPICLKTKRYGCRIMYGHRISRIFDSLVEGCTL
mgnify:CR=1 FL=1